MSRRNYTDDELELLESRRRSQNEPDVESRSKKKRRRWPWLFVILVGLVCLLPNLIGWLGLQQRAIDYALSEFNGSISVERVSLGWLQPIKLTNVTAIDANGSAIFLAESVTSSRSLYSFMTSSDYGNFDVQKPVVYIQLRPDGSNVEDALVNYIGAAVSSDSTPDQDDNTSAALPKLTVNLADGLVIVSTTTSNQMWQMDGFNAITQVGTDDAPLIVDVQCRVTPTVLDSNGQTVMQGSGGLAFTTQFDAGQKGLSFHGADLFLETENLPLSLCAPVLQRFVGAASTTGTMNGQIQAAYNGQDQSLAMDVKQLSLSGFGMVAPDLIGSDQLKIENVSAQGILQVSPALIAAQQFQVRSDVGQIQADGSFDINQLTHLASGGQLLDTPFQMDGDLDLAKLIRMLPSTLQLHQDLVVNSGTVTFQAGSRNENGTKRMVINLDTANINARRGSQNIDWVKPLRLVGTVNESQGKFVLEDVRCISDFLSVVGSADMETGSFVVQGDLDKLMQRVGQFVDLQETKLAGVLDGRFGWRVETSAAQSDPTNAVRNLPIQIGGSFDVFDPIIEMPGMPRWQQKKMSVKLTAEGESQAGKKLRLNQGGIQVEIGNEQLVARLAQPVADAYNHEIWHADCQMTGSMAEWLRHLENFVDFGDVNAGGILNLTCDAAINAQTIQFSKIDYVVEQPTFDGYGLTIREPQAVGSGTAIYELASGNVTIPETTLAGSSLFAQGRDLQITFPGNMRIDGSVEFKADVNRVAVWYEISPPADSISDKKDSIFWYGTINGKIQLLSDENGIGGNLRSTITDLIAAKQVTVPNQIQRPQPGQAIQASQQQRQWRWQEVWREPMVRVSGNVSLANDFNAIGFQNLEIDSSSIKVAANGSIADLAAAMFADISGNWSPNWENISSRLEPLTGSLLKFTGENERRFVVRGPIYETATELGQTSPWVSPSLQAAGNFAWNSGEVLGLAVGGSEMEMNLEQGIAHLKTNGIPFAGGVVQMAPKLDLRGDSPLLTLQQSRIIDNVVLEPETARQWLKYVAPLVADATSAQGKFTVDVRNAAVPVFDPMKMDVEGSVKLTNVVIGAGPAAQQLLGTVKQLRAILKPGSSDRDYETWLEMSEQTVSVTARGGRIYHDNVRLAHKDLVVQTRGSVGFDQTLNLIAEIPIRDDWIAGNRYLAGLRGKSISIPVGGTISKPVLDNRAVQQLSRDLVQQAAGSLINDKINEERDKLLGKFGEQLGLPNGLPQTPPGQNSVPPAKQQSLEEQLKSKAQDELIKGIGNLFGK